jgi:aspartate dehydrogenase
MKVAIIGSGAIGTYVRDRLSAIGVAEVAQIVRAGKADLQAFPPKVSELSDLPIKPDLIVDCGGHAALAAFGPDALAMGIDVLTVSLGALADEGLEARLTAAARDGGARLHLASGAIGGLDALRSAAAGKLSAVTYTGRKPPEGWLGSPAETKTDLHALSAPFTHFSGSAREAALAYPKNANVAAAVALSGLGMDNTQVALIADPYVTENIHEVAATGDFGKFTFRIAGQGLPDNPKSSALAAMSVLAAIAEMKKPIGF